MDECPPPPTVARPCPRRRSGTCSTGWAPAAPAPSWRGCARPADPWRGSPASSSPGSIAEDPLAAQIDGWFPDLTRSFTQIWSDDRTGTKQAWEYGRDLANRSLLRRIHSRRSLLENMVDFWSNHLHVSSEHFPAFAHRPSYDALLRRHALGSFETLLTEATLHPAMVLYLDTWLSERDHPNENHGRELLELHTVGRTAGYTEAMVKDSARILSGHTVRSGWSGSATDPWAPYYDPGKHALGSVTVLGFRHANDDPPTDAAVARAYLPYLARHPSTARRIARKLCVRFVADDPPEALVDSVAQAYLDSATSITATLRALVRSRDFRASVGRKATHPVRRPRPHRAGARDPPRRPRRHRGRLRPLAGLDAGVDAALPVAPARRLPRRRGSWGSATRMLNVLAACTGRSRRLLAQPGRDLPHAGLVAARAPIRFDLLVDHLCRLLLGRRSSATLLQAACDGHRRRPRARSSPPHPRSPWKMPRLLAGPARLPRPHDPVTELDHDDRPPVGHYPPRPGCCADSRPRRGSPGGGSWRAVAAGAAAGVSTSVFGDAVRQAVVRRRDRRQRAWWCSASAAASTGSASWSPTATRRTPRRGPASPSRAGRCSRPARIFGLHPELAPLQWLWSAGELAAVHAVGLPVPNRSHFEAMELVEDADPGSAERRGWVNRMVGLGGAPAASEAVHIGDAMPPTMISGPTPSVATRTLRDVRVAGSRRAAGQPRAGASCRLMWDRGTAARSARAASSALRRG